ncbi:MAG: hypothetical protein HYZ42_10060 [Bacteroidetes bacterium]|nr:hypothetical protein [Bacteroidota bacterium]
MNKFVTFFILLGIISVKSIQAQTPTWAEDVAPILYKSCTSCHHSGGLAPFSLMSYSDAISYASSMKAATNDLRMPPWPPEKNWGSFAHERTLTAAQIKTIADWADNGAVQGDLSKAPTAPSYNGTITMTNPDLEVAIPSYTLKSNVDEYRCFPIKSNITTAEHITGIEVIPGNNEVVHHVLVFQDLSTVPFYLDNADSDPGYLNFGGTGSNSSKLIGAWVPGMQPTFYPPGMGVKFPANTNIILQIHYPAGKKGQVDQTKVRFKLSTGAYREISISPELYHTAPVLQNGPLYIPANQTKTFVEKYTVPIDVSVLDIGPHMHLIGQSIKETD